MKSFEIRKAFLDFFKKNEHPIIESSSIIPEGDPSLLFTSAGMVQFKPYYLGLKTDLKRAASCQKCFRTTDIDNVGKTIRHLTFFEMLGNFSFGDYFKEESLKWGYEFLTKEMGIEPKKLFFSVYKGGIAPRDEEAFNIWKKILPYELHSHIFEMGEDNFWTMGETGPSGPCSEIYYDRGEEFSKDHNCKGPSCGCDRYIEIWNHVFTQFDRQKDGTFKPLPKKNIDTGMGLERLSFIIENKFSPFETSLFYPVIESFIDQNFDKVTDETKKYFETIKKYSSSKDDFKKNVIDTNAYQIIPNLRIISDHLRGSVFLISAGVIPSNEGRGYILRRLIRRAERFGMILGIKEPFLYKLVPSVVSIFGNVYEEVNKNKTHIESILKFEEEGFLKTLENGEKYLNELLENSTGKITGTQAFKLYETYGFPLELTKEIAAKRNIEVDETEFLKAKEEAQSISRAAWKSSGEKNSFIFQKAEEKLPKTIFTGYEKFEDEANLLAIIDLDGNILEKAAFGDFWLAFDKTPFYAESGGQVADTGLILKDNQEVAQVFDVQKPLGGVFYHKVKIIKPISVGEIYHLKIDFFRRKKIAANHTSVHLINAALKKVFGDLVRQAGSLVDENRFRFDYTINKTPLQEELEEVERIANQAILQGYRVFKEYRPLKDAEKFNAVTLVGEKYSDPARFVLINHKGFEDANDRYSLELCGGTHVDSLSEVFEVKIIKDSSVSRGVRRIEGTSGYALIDYLKKIYFSANEAATILSCQISEIPERINKMKENERNLKEEIKKLKVSKTSTENEKIEKIQIGEKNLILKEVEDFDIKVLRQISDKLRNEMKKSWIFVYSKKDGKINFTISTTRDLKDTDASFVAKKFSEKISGKAGGRQDFAQGAGLMPKDVKSITEILVEAIK